MDNDREIVIRRKLDSLDRSVNRKDARFDDYFPLSDALSLKFLVPFSQNILHLKLKSADATENAVPEF